MFGSFGTARVMIEEIELACAKQIAGFLNHPAFTEPIAIMPDTHAGKGSVIGFTMPIVPDRIIPNVIGVDIGCGMLAINIGQFYLGIASEQLDARIRNDVPFGKGVHANPAVDMAQDFPWEHANMLATNFASAYATRFGATLNPPLYNEEWFSKKCRDINIDEQRVVKSVGTLGGGNHFIEFGRSAKTDEIWLVIHTGSRGFGAKIAEYLQSVATDVVRPRRAEALRWRIAEIKKSAKGEEIALQIKDAGNSLGLAKGVNDDPAMDWLEGEEAAGYLFDMIFAQVYAEYNRHTIAQIIMEILNGDEVDRIETVHNFIDFHDFITRKGAIRSYPGERMIIPFNMLDGILICKGKSNAEWNCSAPHGAGRLMSRGDALRNLDIETFRKEMENAGIFSTSVCKSTLDEAAGAYKPATMIERAIAPTAQIVDRLKPIHNLKDIGK